MPQTLITGQLFLPASLASVPTPAAGIDFKIIAALPAEGDDEIYASSVVTRTADEDGLIFFYAPRGGTIWVYSNASGFNHDPVKGTPLAVPDAAEALLSAMISPIEIPQQIPIAVPGGTTFSETVYLRSSHATFALALAEASVTGGTLLIDADGTVSVDTTIPADVKLVWDSKTNSKLSVDSGKVLTINSDAQGWPLRQLFTGSGAVKWGPNIGVAYPQWFGAAMDNATDDKAAAQKAIDAFAKASSYQQAGIVEITGGMAIGSTLTILNNAIRLRGQGWGSSINGQARSYIRWIGSAGSPMILINDCQGASVEDLRVIGKTSAKPSAGIEFRDTSVNQAQDYGMLRNVYVGHFYGYDIDSSGHQFVAGILLSGIVNGDGNHFSQLGIAGCDYGIDIQNNNATTTHIGVVTITDCGTGIRTKTDIVLDCWQNGNNGTDLEFDYPGVFADSRLFQSEGAGRMCKFNGHADCSLIVRSGSFGNEATRFTPADSGNDRWMIDAGDVSGALTIYLEAFKVVIQGSSPKNHVIRAGHTGTSSAPLLRFIDVEGIESTNILLGLAGSFDKNKGPYVEILKRRTSGVVAHEYSRNFIDGNRAEDKDFQNLRTDYLGKVNIFGGPHKVKRLFVPTGVAATPTGSGATTYSYRVSALTYDGETEVSSAVTCVNNATLSGSAYNDVTWLQSQGAYAYRIYGRSSGSEQLMKTITIETLAGTMSYRDTGVDTPSGAFPTSNTTGNASVEGMFSAGKGTDVASAATITPTGNVFHVTGTTTITSVSGTGITAGTTITIIFDGILTFTDGSNLKLAGNFVTSADDTITLQYDGTNWYELCRSVN